MDSSDDVLGALDAFSIVPDAGCADLLLGAEQSSSASVSVPASSGDNSSAAASQGSVSGKGRKRVLSSEASTCDGVGDVTQFEGILDYLANANGDATSAFFENMKSGSSLFEDFAAMVARDGALSATTEITPPLEGEDFVAYLARTNGIRDEKLIRQMREAVMWHGNNKIEQPPMTSSGPSGKDTNNLALSVGEEEDAMSFFVRAGSWDSSSSISQDLASAGLAEDEDAASYLMRTGNLTADSAELSRFITSGPLHQRPTKSGLSSSRSAPGPVSPGQGKRKLLITETGRLKREKLFPQIGQTVT